MATRKMSAAEARANFGDLLGSVHYTKEPVIIEKKGRAFAVVISAEEYESILRERENAFRVVDRIRERNLHVDAVEAEKDVAAAIEAVRQEMHEEETIKHRD